MSASDYIIAPLPLPPGPSPSTPMDDLDNELSYFRIAAIHGAPYVGWGRCDSPPTHSSGNFCVHGDVTFPTFHRVYMMLFEQRLYEIMQQVVASKPASEQPQWIALWQNWRLPTWNWGTPAAKGLYSIPDVYMLPNWPPDSATPNPLWKFINPVKDTNGNPVAMGSPAMGEYGLPKMPGRYWADAKATSRHAQVRVPYPDQEFVIGTNQFVDLNLELNNPDWYDPGEGAPKGSIKELVFHMLTTNYTNYGSFASTKWYPTMPAAEAINLKYIHNNIHDFTGGTGTRIGHMNDISVAAFDPIFWQHHSYIDELFAIWQALPQNKSHWFDNPFPPQPQQGILADPLSTDDLQPFNFSTSRLYNSNDVKDISSLNYDYAFPKDPTQLVAWVNNTFVVSRWNVLNRAQDLAGKKNSYVANVIYDKYALNGSYKIHFFFGEVGINVETATYHQQKNYVGAVATLGGSTEHCANCKKQKEEGALSRAQVMLTVPLINIALDDKDTSLQHLQLGGEEDSGVWNFLKNNLSYNVISHTGQVVPNDDERLKDLKITVLVGKATHYEDETRLSKFEDYRSLFTILKGEHVDEDPWQTPNVLHRANDLDD